MQWALAAVVQAREIVNYLDPVGVGARDLRECLLIQICAQQREAAIVSEPAQEEKLERCRCGLQGYRTMQAEAAGEADVFSYRRSTS